MKNSREVFSVKTINEGRMSKGQMSFVKGGEEAACDTLWVDCLIKATFKKAGSNGDNGTIAVVGLCVCNAKY